MCESGSLKKEGVKSFINRSDFDGRLDAAPSQAELDELRRRLARAVDFARPGLGADRLEHRFRAVVIQWQNDSGAPPSTAKGIERPPFPMKLAFFFIGHREFRDSIGRDLEEGYEDAFKLGGSDFARLYAWRQMFGIVVPRVGKFFYETAPAVSKLASLIKLLWEKLGD
jgi:hypothetical protein